MILSERDVLWYRFEKTSVRAHGGNFLINMGPDAEGNFTHLEYRRFKEFGEYVKAHPALMPEWPA